MGVLCLALVYNAVLSVLPSFANILMGERESWLLCFNCLPDVLGNSVFCGSSLLGWSAVCDSGIY